LIMRELTNKMIGFQDQKTRVLLQRTCSLIERSLFAVQYAPIESSDLSFEHQRGNAFTVNGEQYQTIIRELLQPQLEKLGLQNFWFQQNGATCYTYSSQKMYFPLSSLVAQITIHNQCGKWYFPLGTAERRKAKFGQRVVTC